MFWVVGRLCGLLNLTSGCGKEGIGMCAKKVKEGTFLRRRRKMSLFEEFCNSDIEEEGANVMKREGGMGSLICWILGRMQDLGRQAVKRSMRIGNPGVAAAKANDPETSILPMNISSNCDHRIQCF